jgi:UDPglucose 6-dehydrogenase
LSTKPSRIAVVGSGHVGLVTAAGLAELGHEVCGLDSSKELVTRLCEGDVPILEPGLAKLVRKGLGEGRLSFTTSYDAAVARAEFIFLAVDTPQTLAGAADLRNLRSAIRSIAAALNGTNPIIINKSTSPIGTGETIESILADALQDWPHRPRIVSNPEFLRQGRAVEDFLKPDRIVVGARSAADAQAVARLYSGIDSKVIITDLRTAEMIKYVANSFLATRVSFINEIARLCEQINVDIDMVVEGVSLDPRVGRHFFHPGIGFGGSCLPKDVAALRFMGEASGVATPVLSAVQEVNTAQRTAAVRKLRARLGGSLEGRVVGVWGLTFKAGTEDTRESPAMDVVRLLENDGAIVRAYDPGVTGGSGLDPELAASLCSSAIDAARGADALAVLTDWPEFATVALDEVRSVMRGSVLFDGRNVLPREAAEAAGFAYMGVGRSATPHRRRSTDG